MHRWNLEMIADWRRYGSEKFAFEIMEADVPAPERYVLEQYWIDAEQAFDKGYNLNPKAASAMDRCLSAEERLKVEGFHECPVRRPWRT